MSRYASVNALNLRAVVVAEGSRESFEEFLLSREESGREDMALWVLTEAIRRALA